MQGRDVNIIINLDYNENYINIDLANQLLIPKRNIIEKKDIFQYISQFYVNYDIVIGLPWFKSLGTFILNMEKKL